LDNGQIQLLMPTTASTLPGGATYVEEPLVR
jgi:hypothetical protein